MSAARGVSTSTYVRAGNTAADAAIGAIRAARRNSPNMGEIVMEGQKQRAQTKATALKAEADIHNAGIRKEAAVRKARIQADLDKSLAKSRATVRKAGKIAAAGTLIGDGITEGKKEKARYAMEQRHHEEVVAAINRRAEEDTAEGEADETQMQTDLSDLPDVDPKPTPNPGPESSEEVATVSGVTPSQPIVSSNLKPLQQLIHDRESYGGNYGAFNLRGEDDGHTPIGSGIDDSLTSMTVQQVMNTGRHAQGGYQIIPSTLSGLMEGKYGDTGVKLTDKFDKTTQDKFFGALARKRVVPGNPQATMKGLRNEWVGLQNVDDSILLPAVKQFMSGL